MAGMSASARASLELANMEMDAKSRARKHVANLLQVIQLWTNLVLVDELQYIGPPKDQEHNGNKTTWITPHHLYMFLTKKSESN